MGVQFDELFTDNLYFEISKHGIDMAEKMKKMFVDRNYEFFIDSPTNQQFIILDDEQFERIGKEIKFSVWEKLDGGRTVVRFATSWSTTEQDLKALEKVI